MSEAREPDRVGPVDVAVIAFDGNNLSGELAPTLADLQADGVVRFIDLAFVTKDEHGATEIAELTDDKVNSSYRQIADPRFDLLEQADLASLASALPLQSSALVVVWENSWAANLVSAVRESNGRVMALERIPFDVVRRALEAIEE